MALCSLKCLQCMVFSVAVVILVAVGIGPIAFGIIFRNEDIIKALDLQNLFLGVSIGVGAVVIVFSFCGICGSCKSDTKTARYCLCWYFIFLLIVIVLVAGLLVLFILVNKNGEDNLNKFCGDPQPTYSGLWDKLDNLRSYDNEVEMIGGTGGSLCQDGCACQLPTSPPIPTNSLTGNKYGAYRDNHVAGQGSRVQIGRIFYSPTGKKKISDCPAWNNYDKLTQSFFAVMGQVENSFSCSGICVTGNLSIAHDSTNSKVLQNYQAREGSCFTKIIDFSKERFTIGIGLFAGLLGVLFFSIVFVCCICYHEDLKD